MLVKLFNIVAISWPVSEVILGVVTRGKRRSATVKDRGSLVLLWMAIVGGLAGANLIRFSGVGAIGANPPQVLFVALVLVVLGLAVRWTAILTLGQLFTSNVAVQADQVIVRSGIYRHVRHPSYSGLLLAFVGLGFAFDNWVSLAVMLSPIVAALLYRIHTEEIVLVEALGREYVEYCKATRRLIPGVY